jgi:hypothetical protein
MLLSISLDPTDELNKEHGIDEALRITLEVTGMSSTDERINWYLSIPQDFLIGDLGINFACLEQVKADKSFILSVEYFEANSVCSNTELKVLTVKPGAFIFPLL